MGWNLWCLRHKQGVIFHASGINEGHVSDFCLRSSLGSSSALHHTSQIIKFHISRGRKPVVDHDDDISSTMANSTHDALREVRIEALVLMRILKHATATFPIPATGCLVGMDVAASQQLQLTNCFALPAAAPDLSSQDSSSYYSPSDPAALAAAAPRAKSNVAYRDEMIKYLREVNVDAQPVGWYTSTNMGNFVSLNLIENQYFYQKAADEKTVALVVDVGRASAGSLAVKAYRLSPSFMAAYKEGKFNTERCVVRIRIHMSPRHTE